MRPGRVRAAALHHRPHPVRRYPQDAIGVLACPHCGSVLSGDDDTFLCSKGHSFDIAKQGYVALLGASSRTDTGDSADMVAARQMFLDAGHYAAIAAAIGRSVGSDTVGPVLEIGAGTGYYLSAVLDASGNGSAGGGTASAGVALDSSKFAARRAAVDSRVLSVVADAWSALPIRSESVGTVLSVFAPRDPGEVRRVLRCGGRFIAVTPNPAHLAELREDLDLLTVDDGKADRLVAAFDGLLRPAGTASVTYPMTLTRPAVSALVRMGPTARHLAPERLATQVAALPDSFVVTASVTVSTFDRG